MVSILICPIHLIDCSELVVEHSLAITFSRLMCPECYKESKSGIDLTGKQ